VMAACHDPAVPWHRVVRSDGSVAKGAAQRSLLAREGVPFRGERVDMDLCYFPAE
jgi:alkylated DNA nucleotide flippase Atl1